MPVRARKPASTLSPGRQSAPPVNSSACPPTRISPPSGTVSRLMQRSKVDLPEPEGPISATTLPRGTSSEMFLSTFSVPKDLRSPRMLMAISEVDMAQPPLEWCCSRRLAHSVAGSRITKYATAIRV